MDDAKALEVERGYSWTPAAAIRLASRTACAGYFDMTFASGLECPRGICCDVSLFRRERGLDRSSKANRQRCDTVRMSNGGVVEILEARPSSKYLTAYLHISIIKCFAFQTELIAQPQLGHRDEMNNSHRVPSTRNSQICLAIRLEAEPGCGCCQYRPVNIKLSILSTRACGFNKSQTLAVHSSNTRSRITLTRQASSEPASLSSCLGTVKDANRRRGASRNLGFVPEATRRVQQARRAATRGQNAPRQVSQKAADSAKFPLQLQHAQALQRLMCRASDSTASVNPPAFLQGAQAKWSLNPNAMEIMAGYECDERPQDMLCCCPTAAF